MDRIIMLIALCILAAGQTLAADKLGCVPLKGVKPNHTPVDLSYAYAGCMKENETGKAVLLANVIIAQEYFDTLRLGGAIRKLEIIDQLVASKNNEANRTSMQELFLTEMMNGVEIEDTCKFLLKMGPPTYDLSYLDGSLGNRKSKVVSKKSNKANWAIAIRDSKYGAGCRY